MTCPLCHTALHTKIDLYYFDCSVCRALVKDKKYYPNAEEEKARYLTHNNNIEDVKYQEFTSPITQYILKNFSKTDEGLDFGSGTGPVISAMLKKENYQVKQYDPYFERKPTLLQQNYNYIFACEVVEHFYKPKDEFKRLKAMLKHKGKLILMTLLYEESIDFENWYYRKDPTHVCIYRRETFEYIKTEFNFQQVEIKNRLIVLQ